MALDDRTIGHPSPRWLLGLSLLRMAWLGGFPVTLVVRIQCFLCRDQGSVTGCYLARGMAKNTKRKK